MPPEYFPVQNRECGELYKYMYICMSETKVEERRKREEERE